MRYLASTGAKWLSAAAPFAQELKAHLAQELKAHLRSRFGLRLHAACRAAAAGEFPWLFGLPKSMKDRSVESHPWAEAGSQKIKPLRRSGF